MMARTVPDSPVQPATNRLVVKRLDHEWRSRGGIHLVHYDEFDSGLQPDREYPLVLVLAVGPCLHRVKRDKTDMRLLAPIRHEVPYSPEIKRGDIVLLNRYAGSDIKDLGDGMLCPHISDVLARVDELEDGQTPDIEVYPGGYSHRH